MKFCLNSYPCIQAISASLFLLSACAVEMGNDALGKSSGAVQGQLLQADFDEFQIRDLRSAGASTVDESDPLLTPGKLVASLNDVTATLQKTESQFLLEPYGTTDETLIYSGEFSLDSDVLEFGVVPENVGHILDIKGALVHEDDTIQTVQNCTLYARVHIKTVQIAVVFAATLAQVQYGCQTSPLAVFSAWRALQE